MFFILSLVLGTACMPAPHVDVPDTLQAVVVSADRSAVVSRVDTLIVDGSISDVPLSDVLSRMPGVQINDYGGIAGTKNISIRGMGSTHTSVMVDGIKVGNAQSGMIDLGMLGLENMSSMTVDYVGSRVNLTTARPGFREGRSVCGRVALNAGSFGTWIPSARLGFKLSDKVSASVNASGNVSRGDFPFGDGQRRDNNDMHQFRGGADVFGDGWKVKMFWNSSDRGVPGSLTWPSADRQKDRNAFVQGTVGKSVTGLYSFDVRAKVSYDRMLYTAPTYANDYLQYGAMLGTCQTLTPARWCRISLNEDIQGDILEADSFGARRISNSTKLVSAFEVKRLKADVALEYIGAWDGGGVSHSCFAPSLGLRFKASEWFDMVGTVRRAYRIPNFNDLYYTGMGNPELLPEDAWMTGLELSAHSGWGRWKLAASGDLFYNSLKNKIVSAPTEDPYLWMMYNLGEAEVYGVDSMLSLRYESDLSAGLMAGYAFQDGTMIPYQPRHSVRVAADIGYKGWSLSAGWSLRGTRHDSYDAEMPSYSLWDITLVKKLGDFTVKLLARNVCDRYYEIVTSYPMPGVNVMGTIQYEF